ncbi:hypothetical protein L596_004921 [Steinernema carpocapsae]|uniref:Uncharacterized protein n=1 Tax=Steinernema carpocapsae TaxID=34508 RepID=A0A4U8UXB9_STECR|nr:hypothetical protein L596_004921 [Steinernema carpocapsae]
MITCYTPDPPTTTIVECSETFPASEDISYSTRTFCAIGIRSLRVTALDYIRHANRLFAVTSSTNEDIVDRVESRGTRRTTSGRSFAILRRSRPRAYGLKIFTSNATADTQNGGNGTFWRRDLHTAYRLPLQRLSNHQLKMLIKKYTKNDTSEHPEIINGVESQTRVELLENLQEMILKNSAKETNGRKLMRPKLISNALLPTNEVHAMGIPIINKKSQQRTTVSTFQMAATTKAPARTGSGDDEADVRRSSKAHVPLSVTGATKDKAIEETSSVADGETSRSHPSYAEHIISKGDVNSKQYLRELSDMLRKVKAKYEQIRFEYLSKIKRTKAVKPTSPAASFTTSATPSTAVPSTEASASSTMARTDFYEGIHEAALRPVVASRWGYEVAEVARRQLPPLNSRLQRNPSNSFLPPLPSPSRAPLGHYSFQY